MTQTDTTENNITLDALVEISPTLIQERYGTTVTHIDLKAVSDASDIVILIVISHSPARDKLPLLSSRLSVKKGKGKDVDLYSAFHAPGTPNAHTSLKLTRQTAI